MKNKIAGALIVMLQISPTTGSAAQIPTDRAVKAIIGEAENQGPRGMYFLACAIRNRGTLKGVYGYLKIQEVNGKYFRVTPKGARRIPDQIVKDAKAAWEKSLAKRIHSATHWENVNAFGMPEWAREMKVVARVGDHVFFQPMSKMSKGV
jgi:hypothetical protein